MADQWREIDAQWLGGGAFLGKNAKGATVQVGTFGEKPGVSPMEFILVGLAGCTGVDIVDILQKKRQPLKALKVIVRGNRREEYPKIFSEIEVTYLVWGDGIDPKAVERAIELSEKKYCSVSAMLQSAAKISSSSRILTSTESTA